MLFSASVIFQEYIEYFILFARKSAIFPLDYSMSVNQERVPSICAAVRLDKMFDPGKTF